MSGRMILDYNDAMERVGDDKELYLELLQLFFDDYKEKHPQLGLFVRGKDASKIERGAHAIKSALGNLSAQRAYDAAQVLELMGKQNKTENVEEGFRILETEVEAFRKECNSKLGLDL